MPGGKIIRDVTDPDVPAPARQPGNTTTEGIGATVGTDVHDYAAQTSAAQQAITGSIGGESGSVFGGETGTNAGALAGIGTAQSAGPAPAPGRMVIVDPWLQRLVPLYNVAQQRHAAAVSRVVGPLEAQQDVIFRLIQKFQSQTGWWAGIENFLTDPAALVAAAGAVVTGGASAGVAAQRALAAWKTELGAEDAIPRLQKAQAALDAKIRKVRVGAGVFKAFSGDAFGAPTYLPMGTEWISGAHRTVGKDALPPDFVDWYKHTRKMWGQSGLWFHGR